MNEVVIVDAVRSPIGRRGGGLSSLHSADLLATVQSALIERSGIDPAEVGQVVGGCVSQVGMQSFNVTRTRPWPGSSRSPAPTACTPRARRRRSRMAPRRCC
jgi:acetyl-CoA C-acetyltransferase